MRRAEPTPHIPALRTHTERVGIPLREARLAVLALVKTVLVLIALAVAVAVVDHTQATSSSPLDRNVAALAEARSLR
jgi:hypothetical protein